MDEAQREQFLEHMRNGMRRGAAAYAMGLTRLTVLDFIATDEEFERAVLDAEAEAHEHVEEAIFQAAVSGSVAAARLWMNLRKPKPSMDLVPLDDEGDMDTELAELNRLATE